MPLQGLRHPAHLALHHRLWSHRFEDPTCAIDPVRRLAREQRWSLERARQGIEEYRRFCFLACVAGHAVTPSEEVDAVWHMHLLHTRDYWEVFCPKVLQRSLHHGPTQGGREEDQRFYLDYAQTLASYQAWFGPPDDAWWPRAGQRFQPAHRWQWVYRPDVWLIPHPRCGWRRFITWLRTTTRRTPR